jgi:hypothetical protein
MRIPALAGALCAVVLTAATAAAQGTERDSSWTVAWDDPTVADSSLFLVVMRPGWHVTTPVASGVTITQPDSVAGGSYLVKSVVFTFNADAGPMGLVLGADPTGSAPDDYVMFLLNNDGTFGVFHRGGSEEHTIVPWTHNEAVRRKLEGDGGPAKNVLSVLAGADSVRFYVNGVEVTHRARQQLDMDGTIGMRVEGGTNLHVSELTVASLGPAR